MAAAFLRGMLNTFTFWPRGHGRGRFLELANRAGRELQLVEDALNDADQDWRLTGGDFWQAVWEHHEKTFAEANSSKMRQLVNYKTESMAVIFHRMPRATRGGDNIHYARERRAMLQNRMLQSRMLQRRTVVLSSPHQIAPRHPERVPGRSLALFMMITLFRGLSDILLRRVPYNRYESTRIRRDASSGREKRRSISLETAEAQDQSEID